MRAVIIGNGVAGVTAARTIVENRVDAEVNVYTDESYPYYPRPRLPAFLAGDVKLKDLYFYPEDWYRKKGVAVHLNARVIDVNPANKEVTLADSSKIAYDKLLLAMGSSAFMPLIEGTDKQGVFILRSVKDALAIRDYAKGVKKAVVIGGGLLGLEAARSLKMLGLETTVVEVFPRLLPKQLDEEGAVVLTRLIKAMGIRVVTSGVCEAILGSQKATGVLLKGGHQISGELILISAGVSPNIELAKRASIEVHKGIIVNEYMQTSVEYIYAAGDAAEFDNRTYGIIPAALEQAKVAGLNLTTERPTEKYSGTVPFTTLKVMGIDLTSIGLVNPEGPGQAGPDRAGENYHEIRKTDEDRGIYRKIVFKDGYIVGAIFIGDRKRATIVSRLLSRKVNVAEYVHRPDRPDLLDDDFDFKKLLHSEGSDR